ncbi:FtsB family cell division protein [Aquimarina algicola]|nr:septum formation initiator family protein [Aquimarina algicola]
MLIILLFVIWMLFLDTNSWLIHRELDQEIQELEENKEYYIKEIVKDQKNIKTLKDSGELEKFAREEYFMKRDNEEIYIIEYEDSVTKNKNND